LRSEIAWRQRKFRRLTNVSREFVTPGCLFTSPPEYRVPHSVNFGLLTKNSPSNPFQHFAHSKCGSANRGDSDWHHNIGRRGTPPQASLIAPGRESGLPGGIYCQVSQVDVASPNATARRSAGLRAETFARIGT
jgi:hypothetical protein